MYLDALLLVSDAQAVTATAVSTNTIDNGAAGRTIGTGEPLGFGLAVDVAADSTTGNETYQFDVISSAAANLGSPVVHASYILTAAQLAAGALWFLGLPSGTPTLRYLGLQYTTGGTTPTITVTAWLTARSLFSLTPTHYPKNYAV